MANHAEEEEEEGDLGVSSLTTPRPPRRRPAEEEEHRAKGSISLPRPSTASLLVPSSPLDGSSLESMLPGKPGLKKSLSTSIPSSPSTLLPAQRPAILEPLLGSTEDVHRSRPATGGAPAPLASVISSSGTEMDLSRLRSAFSSPTPAIDQTKLHEWLFGFCVVNFDLDVGQSLEWMYPMMPLSTAEINDICFSVLPDSNVSAEGDCVYTIRLPCQMPMAAPRRAGAEEGIVYGYVYFRQQRNADIRRGYLQKSIVLLTPYPYHELFTAMMRTFGPYYFRQCGVTQPTRSRRVSLDYIPPFVIDHPLSIAIDSVLTKWPTFKPQEHFLVNQMTPDATFTLPWVDASSFDICFDRDWSLKAPKEELNAHLDLHGLAEELWTIWELMLVGEPILVLASSPAACGRALRCLQRLMKPLAYNGDWRPYFTIHNSEFKPLSTTSRAIPLLLIGATNPFFLKAFEHWPNIIQLDGSPNVHRGGAKPVVFSPATTPLATTPNRSALPLSSGRPHGHERMASDSVVTSSSHSLAASPNHLAYATHLSSSTESRPSSASMTSSKRSNSTQGISQVFGIGNGRHHKDAPLRTRWKPYIGRDKVLLRKLLQSDNSTSDADLSDMIFRSFQETTERFLTPLNRYTASLLPRLSAEIEPKIPLPKPFDRTNFFKSLAEHGTSLRCKPRRDITHLYEKFLAGPTFQHWLLHHEAATRAGLIQRQLEVIAETPLKTWCAGRTEDEIDLLRRFLREHLPTLQGKDAAHSKQTAILCTKLTKAQNQL